MVNTEWNSTGPIASLLQVKAEEDTDYIVSYGDILFREKILRDLLKSDADISIAIDSKWKKRYSNRTLEDIERSEKILVSKSYFSGVQDNSKSENANAEFIGLMTLKSKVMKFLEEKSKFFPPEMRHSNLTALLEFFKDNGFKIKIVDVLGDWAELNEAADIANFILGTKAQSLKRLKEVVTLSHIAPQSSFTVSEWNSNQDKVLKDIQSKFKSKNVIVRSSAISEDGFEISNAGAFLSILNVDTSLKEIVSNSISKVIDSYDDNLLNQVLVQPMIENVSLSGVIFTRTLSESAPYYVINFDDVTEKTDTITSGSSVENKTSLIFRDMAGKIDNLIPKALNGLIPAIQEIENLLNFNSLDIEFAIGKDERIHILQVRPLNSDKNETENDQLIFKSLKSSIKKFKKLQKNNSNLVGKSSIFGVMPDWNPAEIIGTKPNILAFDLYRFLITDEVWARQRAEYGYKDVRPQSLLVSFSGHPYVDVRASFNSFIPSTVNNDLASRLVDFYIERLCENPHYHDKVEFEILPTCYAFNFEDWRLTLESGGFSSNEVEELKDSLKVITKNAFSRIKDDFNSVDIFKERFESIYFSDSNPLDKAISLLEDCRNYGTLAFAHLARSGFISISLLKTAVETNIISQAAMDSFLNSVETVAQDFLNDANKVANNKMPWSDYIELYGHLRPGTYDITSEAYSENIEKFMKPVVEQSKNNLNASIEKNIEWLNERESFLDALSKIGISEDTDSVEQFMKDAIEGREYAKFIFSRNLSAALDLIAKYGKNHGLNREQMANISLSSLFKLRSENINSDDVFTFLINEINTNKKIYEETNKIELPPLITSESDFISFKYPNSQPNYIGFTRVSAETLIMDSKRFNKDKLNLKGKILLIPQADPGYDWIFGHNIAGLITMYGGGNSHMAIRANEFGLPAAIGVGEAMYKTLCRAAIIDLDVANRKIEIIR